METIYYSLDAKRLTVCGEAAGRRASGGQGDGLLCLLSPRPRRPVMPAGGRWWISPPPVTGQQRASHRKKPQPRTKASRQMHPHPRRGRPPKDGKSAPGKAAPRDKKSQGKGQLSAPAKKKDSRTPGSGKAAPVVESKPPLPEQPAEPRDATRPVNGGDRLS